MTPAFFEGWAIARSPSAVDRTSAGYQFEVLAKSRQSGSPNQFEGRIDGWLASVLLEEDAHSNLRPKFPPVPASP